MNNESRRSIIERITKRSRREVRQWLEWRRKQGQTRIIKDDSGVHVLPDIPWQKE